MSGQEPVEPMPDGLRERLQERVGWLELFFDLVVIAGIALLSHDLHADESLAGLGLFVLIYGAIWMTWVSVVLYADVAGARTRTRTVLIAMVLVAVMAATAPAHHEERANLFAVAFFLTRGLIGREAWRTGRVLASWPLLQFGGFSLPWVASLWVPVPWKYVLWAAALVGDLVLVVTRGEQVSVDHLAREERAGRRGRERRRRSRWIGQQLTMVEVDRAHLQERLGVFLIIVFGEAVTQLVAAAAEHDWTASFVTIVLVGFGCLVGLWSLTFSYGFDAAPHTRLATVSPRFGLPMHWFATLGILMFAAGFGAMAAAPDHRLGTVMRWVLCGGLALNFAVSGISGLLGRAPRVWLLGVALPTTLLPLALAAAAGPLDDRVLAWLCLVPIGWQVTYAHRADLLERFGHRPTR